MDFTNIGIYKSNAITEIMGVQQYCLRIVYVFINLVGIFAKMVKMAKEYRGNVGTIFNVQVNHEKILKLEGLDKSHQDSFYDRKGDYLNLWKTLKEKIAAAGVSNSNAVSVPPSTAQSTNVSF